MHISISKWTLPLICVLVLALSCSLTKKSTSNHNNRQLACSGKEIPGPHFDWIIENNEVLKGHSGTAALPAVYKVYSTDSEQVANFFMVAGNNMQGVSNLNILMPLPEPTGCQLYELTFSDKMPLDNKRDIVVSKGKGVNSGQNTISLRYDGEKMHINLTCNNMGYSVEPIVYNGKVFYILSQASAPAINKAVQQPYTPPQMSIHTYDK